MFTFTDADGNAVPTPAIEDIATIDGSDIRNLPILMAAAEAADRAGYCGVYDDIAQQIGGPTRSELRDLGLVRRYFNVAYTRPVTVTLTLTQTQYATVLAVNPAQAIELAEAPSFADVDVLSGYDIRAEVDRYATFPVSEVGEVTVGRATAQ